MELSKYNNTRKHTATVLRELRRDYPDAIIELWSHRGVGRISEADANLYSVSSVRLFEATEGQQLLSVALY
jgi:hypothetical protein